MIMDTNTKESEFNEIAQKVVNSVLESDHEITPTNSRRSSILGHCFADGLAFLNVIKSLQKIPSPIKSPVSQESQTWQIWYWKRIGKHRNASWQEFLQEKSKFTTKEEFWSVSNELSGESIDLLSDHFDCFVFKQDVKPMWEDPDNKDGGRWIIQINREHCWKHLVNLDEIWLKVVLSMTGNGEALPEYFDQICGCVLMVRHDMIKIAVWTKNANNTLANLSICQFIKAQTGFTGIMWYERHNTSAATKNSKTKIRFNLPKNESIYC